ncbi:unnamed protein product [Amoebophrya sp. A120]|nr:unnamed protein product [Amoebophrya sp. A120]|eukprot:GSA120T00010861001.1
MYYPNQILSLGFFTTTFQNIYSIAFFLNPLKKFFTRLAKRSAKALSTSEKERGGSQERKGERRSRPPGEEKPASRTTESQSEDHHHHPRKKNFTEAQELQSKTTAASKKQQASLFSAGKKNISESKGKLSSAGYYFPPPTTSAEKEKHTNTTNIMPEDMIQRLMPPRAAPENQASFNRLRFEMEDDCDDLIDSIKAMHTMCRGPKTSQEDLQLVLKECEEDDDFLIDEEHRSERKDQHDQPHSTRKASPTEGSLADNSTHFDTLNSTRASVLSGVQLSSAGVSPAASAHYP